MKEEERVSVYISHPVPWEEEVGEEEKEKKEV